MKNKSKGELKMATSKMVKLELERKHMVQDVSKKLKRGVVAYATVIVGGVVTLYNLAVVNGKNGLFLSFPSHKGNDNKYYSYSYIEDESTRERIVNLIMESEE